MTKHNLFLRVLLFCLSMTLFLTCCDGNKTSEGHIPVSIQNYDPQAMINSASPSHKFDFVMFGSNYPGNYGISRVMWDATYRLFVGAGGQAYRGTFFRIGNVDIERSLQYDMLSRKRVGVMFFLPGSMLTALSLALRYPKQKFALPYILNSGQYELPPNLRAAYLKLEQGAFLVGIIAGRMTRNNRVGMLTDMMENITEVSMYAFVQGVRKVNPHSEVIVVQTDSDENTLQNETTHIISREDVDVIFAMSVNYNNTIIRSAQYLGRDVLLINSWYNADNKWPRHVITSFIISVDPIIRNFMSHAGNDKYFSNLPPVESYDLNNRNVMRLSWDGEEDTAFELERPEYSELSRQAREETYKWEQRIRVKEFVVFNALENGIPPAELQDLRFRDLRGLDVVD